MNTKKQALWLSRFYAELEENDNGVTYKNTVCANSPNMNTNPHELHHWKVTPKQQAKIIYLKMMIGSEVDMEFSNCLFDSGLHIDKLSEIQNKKYPYGDCEDYWQECRIRENHWHHWQGGERPIPEGLDGKILLRDKTIYSLPKEVNWHHGLENELFEIISFMVTGKKDGYIYEWEQEK